MIFKIKSKTCSWRLRESPNVVPSKYSNSNWTSMCLCKMFCRKSLELLSTGKSLCFYGLKKILVNVNFTFCFWNFLTWAFNFIHQSMTYAYVNSQIESKTVVPTINNILFLLKQRTNCNEKNTFFGFSNACVLRCFWEKIFYGWYPL